MSDFDEFMVNTVSVQTLQGVNGLGQPQFAAAVNVPCFRDDSRKMTRNRQGDEVVSTTSLYTDLKWASTLVEGSLVTFPAGDLPSRTSTVIKLAVFDSGTLNLPDHIEAALE